MKATLFLPLLALALRVTAQSGSSSQAPACLLAAVNTQDSPADLDAVCGDGAEEVQEAIAKECSKENASIAQEAFIATCSSAGNSVASYTATSTASSTKSGSSGSDSPSSTSDSDSDASGSSSDSGSASGSLTGGSGPQETDSSSAASSNVRDIQGMASFAAAAVAVMGLALGL